MTLVVKYLDRVYIQREFENSHSSFADFLASPILEENEDLAREWCKIIANTDCLLDTVWHFKYLLARSQQLNNFTQSRKLAESNIIRKLHVDSLEVESFTVDELKVPTTRVNAVYTSMGMHGSIKISTDSAESLKLKWSIPKTIFIDEYQIASLFTNYSIFGYSDLEAPTASANAQNHELEIDFSGEISVPFHFRYDKPNELGFVMGSIEFPRLYLTTIQECPSLLKGFINSDFCSNDYRLVALDSLESFNYTIPVAYSQDAFISELVLLVPFLAVIFLVKYL